MQPTNVEGRGLIGIEKRVLEFHTALSSKGENEVERSKAQKEHIDKLNQIYPNMRAKQIPMMPEVLKLNDVFINDNEFKKDIKNYAISLGISEQDIEYKHINLSKYPVLSVVGKAKSGKTNFLNAIAYTLDKNREEADAQLYVVDSPNYGLSGLKDLDIIEEYISTKEGIEVLVEDIHEELSNRYDEINEAKLYMGKDFNIDSVLEYKPHITILIDDAATFTQAISTNRTLLSKFEDIIGKFDNLKVSVVIAGPIEVFTAIPVSQVARSIKEKGVGLVFEQTSNQRMFDFKTSYRNVEKPLKVGEAYFYDNGNYIKVKTPEINI